MVIGYHGQILAYKICNQCSFNIDAQYFIFICKLPFACNLQGNEKKRSLVAALLEKGR